MAQTLIEMLEELEESSIYGNEADKAFEMVKDVGNIIELMELSIDSPEVILRNLHATVVRISGVRRSGLSQLLSNIPSVAVQDNFI